MISEILIGGGISTLSGLVGFFISKKMTNANFEIYTQKAKAKASVIENEAYLLLSKANTKSQDIELQAQQKFDNAKQRARSDFQQRENDILVKEKKIHNEFSSIKAQKINLDRSEKSIETLKQKYEKKVDEALHAIENCSGMTKDEAQKVLLEKVQERSRAEIAHIVRRSDEEAKKLSKEKANYILAQATSRFAGNFAAERLVSDIHINDDDMKGRIIGKEGRNIKSLESILGVDIIIDDTPNTIQVSCFNLYRRAIATQTIKLLLEDGRIQPARIEEIHQKVSDEFEANTLHEGEELIADLDVGVMHPELMKLLGKLRYRASYGQNALGHTLEVAHLAGIMASEMGGDARLAKRAGLLHDIGKALTHDVDGNHVDLGAEICNRHNEDSVVINAIYAHHGHEEINSIECGAVCAADALSAARPGARREVLESFLKRVTEIEEIASGHNGVRQAYAINAGREVRVMVNATLINDDESILLAREIAKEIEEKVSYPGEIKVSVIRESRAIVFAK